MTLLFTMVTEKTFKQRLFSVLLLHPLPDHHYLNFDGNYTVNHCQELIFNLVILRIYYGSRWSCTFSDYGFLSTRPYWFKLCWEWICHKDYFQGNTLSQKKFLVRVLCLREYFWIGAVNSQCLEYRLYLYQEFWN